MTDADKKLYDKAVEALDQMGAGLPSEIEKYVPAWIDGYKEGLKVKINATTISDCPIKDEWHFPSKGELPEGHRKRYLIATTGLIVGAETRTNLGKEIVFVNDFGTFEKASEVIAWRELPEPPKEEE